MKFNDFKYERPDVHKVAEQLIEQASILEHAKSLEEAANAVRKANEIGDHFGTMATLCAIRNSINTVDEFYEKEKEYFDENDPIFNSATTKFSKVLVNSVYRKELEKIFTKQYLMQNELNLKSFDEKIMGDLAEEAKLCTEYSKLIASAKIEFDGKINNLSQMTVYSNSLDREVRRAAELKRIEFMESIEAKVDEIYDKLVKVRTRMAQKLGYSNYVDFGYLRLGRSDYNSKDVASYRKQVLETIVPIAKKIIEKQSKRIGIADFKNYDIPIFYKDGNPNHGKDKKELVASATKFYTKLSKETKEFFNFMQDHELMDLETKPNKAGGGYCTLIADYKAPFIFSNFNGTMGDVDVLTHEAGHAFEVYTASKNLPTSDVFWPTLEACEIHSMSMEFFAYPYMDYFFDRDAKKYRFKHLSEAITFIPYGVCVDEFQHYVYENPEATPAMRKEKWHELEKKYTPWKDYDGISYYERGWYWHRQGHIISNAFYYIDYTLAQVCAFQFLLLDQEDHKNAWNKYYDLCKLGGSKSFVSLLEAVDLKNPFEEGSLKEIMPKVEKLLQTLEV
ncbi:MAG: M3 family oligoendopeptidase [Anaeroplasmataceae bacterium]|nr:M3 family oligoendopeptidase [Anaeroplasmataceae bacterium]